MYGSLAAIVILLFVAVFLYVHSFYGGRAELDFFVRLCGGEWEKNSIETRRNGNETIAQLYEGVQDRKHPGGLFLRCLRPALSCLCLWWWQV